MKAFYLSRWLCVLHIVIYLQLNIAEGTLESDFENWANKYREYAGHYNLRDHADEQILNAENISHSLSSEFNQTAVKIVNLYTQDHHWEELKIYRNLNRHLCKPGVNYSDVWDAYAQILSNAIDVLSDKEGVTTRVYRGEKKRQAHYENELCFTNFVSTSRDPKVAMRFTYYYDEATLFDIYNATGVQVHKFSHYADEEEILLKRSFQMTVTERAEGELQIRRKLNEHDIDLEGYEDHIKLYLTGHPSHDRKQACVCFDSPDRSASERINLNMITAVMPCVLYIISKVT